MLLNEIFSRIRESDDDDAEHFDALAKTGFFGKAGAGGLFLAQDTGRFLLAHRSAHVEQPGDWGGWGGAINKDEDPVEAVKREAHEEAGYTGALIVKPLLLFKKADFQYHNFLLIVDTEFTPKLNWESRGFRWCTWGDWPSPLHFGIISLLKDPASVKLMQDHVAAAQSKSH
jgi:8-oxo-dGTP pyrophosphatase MutT (NUDIX family)